MPLQRLFSVQFGPDFFFFGVGNGFIEFAAAHDFVVGGFQRGCLSGFSR